MSAYYVNKNVNQIHTLCKDPKIMQMKTPSHMHKQNDVLELGGFG